MHRAVSETASLQPVLTAHYQEADLATYLEDCRNKLFLCCCQCALKQPFAQKTALPLPSRMHSMH